MQILVDLGNTRLKWARWQQDGLSASQSLLHRDRDLGELLTEAWADIPAPAHVHLASVVSTDKRQQLEQWVEAQWGCEVTCHSSAASQLGVTNGYGDPARLGVDRWLALLGAWQRVRQAVCVVDCGSAVTIDILDGSGQHLGGWIIPGLNMMRLALQSGTALISPEGAPTAALGRDTESGILNGTVQAVVGLIEQAVATLPTSPRLVLAGGDAAMVAQQLKRKYEICPDLVLEGLAGALRGA